MGAEKHLIRKTVASLQTNGMRATAQKVKAYLKSNREEKNLSRQQFEPFMDVLFINGCDPETVPHPPRYRVSHQKEQLLAYNIVANEVYYLHLRLEQVKQYRVFIFFRCPYTPTVGEFISTAKRLHKTVIFDIDDLVIDTSYTDTIPYVQALSKEEKAVYDDGVIRMGKTLSLCDAAITTTEGLAKELSQYVPEVFINRNTASELMLKYSEEACEKKKNKGDDSTKIRVGYFSGSITHNADFTLILPAVIRVLKENPNVELHIVGELDLPPELYSYKKQIVRRPFADWKTLPELIASVDINLAPLESSVFNEAKSENKWVEAALVNIPTVASNIGAFHCMIVDEETGLLCETTEEWYQALTKLIRDGAERERLARNAHQYCRNHCTTLSTGRGLANFIQRKMNPNIAFVLPSLNISGGIMVALKHAKIMYDQGFDVTLINEDPGSGWLTFEGHSFPVISRNHHPIFARIDKAVATMWTTVSFLETYPNIGERYYLVQNYELDFYKPDIFLRVQASQSYRPAQRIQFLTISKWCQKWLLEEYDQAAKYAPNGINTAQFLPHRRVLNGKIRILIEGDCSSYYKNVDESFRIVDQLDPARFEVWYMSYNADPKPEYRVDRFLHCVPYEKVCEVYSQCDILIKSSFLESFSYPPLEMMASGGYIIVVPNDGNREYLRDGSNCLFYALGNVDEAAEKIELLCRDEKLQNTLYYGGIETAKSRDWRTIQGKVLALYT